MTEFWATSSVFLNEAKFNWTINDLTLLLDPVQVGTFLKDKTIIKEVSSPEFKIGNNKFWLHITEKTSPRSLTVKGLGVNPGDYHIVKIEMKSVKDNILIGGSLTIDMEGEKISGIFGDPTRKTVQSSYSWRKNSVIFKNQTSKIEFQGALGDDYFCISRRALPTQIEIKVHLYFRSPITTNISSEPVKDTGLTKLSTDMRAMLNRSAECSDFSIECDGKAFPCHEFILRARSTVLDAMFHNEMTEKKGRSMAVVDVRPNTMAVMLEYMYTGGITAKVDSMKELIYIADKYDMEGLLELCFRKLPEVGDDMVLDFLFMADKHNFMEYKKAAMIRINMNKAKYMEDQNFIQKLKEVPSLLMELYKL